MKTATTEKPNGRERNATERLAGAILQAVQSCAIYTISPEGLIQTWNKGSESIFGYSEREAIGMDFRRFYPREELDLDVPDTEIRDAIANGSVKLEGWRLSKGNKPFYAKASLSAVHDSNGKLLSLVKVVLDDTARRQAEDNMRAIVNAATNTAIYTISPDGIVQSWNKGSENVFGYREHEAIGMDFRTFYPKDELDRNVPGDEIRDASARGSVTLEGWRLAKGNRPFYAQASMSAIMDQNGKVVSLVKVVLDNTDRKRAEDEMLQQQREIADLIAVLNGTSSKVASVAAQLSSSTAQTVAAIAETTATAEEVRQTAELASQRANEITDESKSVIDMSKKGKEATDATVYGMARIKEQMESMAESMTQLTNQSKLIGDIIATVDDLAQQSNLLAVNASIEAAKAGEQGKGFAVVAQEVKNLSDQSKAATAHVRSILNDIVNATTAATMATGQGSKAVDNGHQQAAEAGRVIQVLSESIERAVQSTAQIEVSSRQQLVGMKQMVEAMSNIKVASEQNLQGTSDLESAARELDALGQRLSEASRVSRST